MIGIRTHNVTNNELIGLRVLSYSCKFLSLLKVVKRKAKQ